eukprot:13797070-Alexandrium_andersonii.AAC.1
MVFKAVLQRCHLQCLMLTLASLRAGGATSLIVSGMEWNGVNLLGRWRSEQTTARSVQEAVAQL